MKALDDIEEWSVQPDPGSPISLRSPEEVYMKMYATAYEKAQQMKIASLKAFAKAEGIRALYKLDPMDTNTLQPKAETS